MYGEMGKKEEKQTSPNKKKRSKRITELKERLESLQKKLREEEEKKDAYMTQLKYLQADYENYLKRTEREIDRISKFGNERLITNLLEIVDELELASKASEDASVSEEVKKGVKMIHDKLQRILDREGVTAIECENKPFDPKIHQAISKKYAKEWKEGIVLSEIRRGYLLRGKVIRPSTVVVSTSKSNSSEE